MCYSQADLRVEGQFFKIEFPPESFTQITKRECLMLILSEHEDQRSSWMVEGSELGSGGGESKDGIPLPPTKPRIWSMAELAVSKSSYVGCG